MPFCVFKNNDIVISVLVAFAGKSGSRDEPIEHKPVPKPKSPKKAKKIPKKAMDVCGEDISFDAVFFGNILRIIVL